MLHTTIDHSVLTAAVLACMSIGSHLTELTLLQFGYTRKDVILLGVGILAFGYALYYGLQAAGYDALVAGNIVQIFVFLGIGVGYISTYIFRVANKVRPCHATSTSRSSRALQEGTPAHCLSRR